MALALTEALCGFISSEELDAVLETVPEIKEVVGDAYGDQIVTFNNHNGEFEECYFPYQVRRQTLHGEAEELGFMEDNIGLNACNDKQQPSSYQEIRERRRVAQAQLDHHLQLDQQHAIALFFCGSLLRKLYGNKLQNLTLELPDERTRAPSFCLSFYPAG